MANETFPTHYYPGGGTTQPYIPAGTGYVPVQPYRPQQALPENNTGLMTILVNSEEEVGYYPVAAGVTVLLISFNLRKFWLKSTGKNGVPEALRVFNFDEDVTQAPQGNDYATRDEIKNLNEKIDKLIAELGGVK